MEIRNPVEYLSLGGVIRYLGGADKDSTVYGKNYIFENLKYLEKVLKDLTFEVSVNYYDSYISTYNKQIKNNEKKYKDGEIENVFPDDFDADEFSDMILALEKVVIAEAKTKRIAVFGIRKYQLSHLIENQSMLMGKGVFYKLDKFAKHELVCACKCIAYKCATASAFHILRCVEECIRILYETHFPSKKVNNKTWGTLLRELQNKARKPRPDSILIEHLDHLREKFRNPTDHPDKIYEIEEAEDLLSVAIDAINRCMRDEQFLKKLNI